MNGWGVAYFTLSERLVPADDNENEPLGLRSQTSWVPALKEREAQGLFCVSCRRQAESVGRGFAAGVRKPTAQRQWSRTEAAGRSVVQGYQHQTQRRGVEASGRVLTLWPLVYAHRGSKRSGGLAGTVPVVKIGSAEPAQQAMQATGNRCKAADNRSDRIAGSVGDEAQSSLRWARGFFVFTSLQPHHRRCNDRAAHQSQGRVQAQGSSQGAGRVTLNVPYRDKDAATSKGSRPVVTERKLFSLAAGWPTAG